ncbi:sigma-70 family RNA polymerase sigma factor [Kineococcus sp. NBC_00420]|uniref:RNA polymerase sigma factor n=1 Tax=Kineococcus sp. NBC_00420 TaxID=2903564 RepID=UPI002E1ADD59
MSAPRQEVDAVQGPGSARQTQEEAAFEELYRQTRADLLAYLHRRSGGWAGGTGAVEAADLLAQVYLVAWRRRNVLPPAGQRRPWLYGIARRVLAEYHRAAPAHVSLEDLTHEPSDMRMDWEGGGLVVADGNVTGSSAEAVVLHQALAGLGEVDRELLLLTVLDRLSSGEAARALGISSGAARVRLHRARRRLRTHDGLLSLLEAYGPPILRLAPDLGVQTAPDVHDVPETRC